MSIGKKAVRAFAVTIMTVAAAGSIAAAPALAEDHCPGYGVDTPDGEIGVCPGTLPPLDSHTLPYNVGPVCVGSICTPPQSGSVPFVLPGDSQAPSTYCTDPKLCSIIQ